MRKPAVVAAALMAVLVGLAGCSAAAAGHGPTSAGGSSAGPSATSSSLAERAPSSTSVTVPSSPAHPGPASGSGTAPAASTTAASRRGRSTAPAADYFRLVQYPAAGFAGYDSQIAHATRAIDIEMYELADVRVEHLLAAAVTRGVAVRVLLDRDYHAGTVNQPAYRYLAGHGVSVTWGPSGVIYHVKLSIFDGSVADISTANLTSRYYATTRDAEIVDTDPAQVRAAELTFDHDFAAGPTGRPADDAVQAAGLVWSPDTGSESAQTEIVDQIAGAEHSVYVESEEMSDAAVVRALEADARRHVTCKLVMTESASWTSEFTALTDAGCDVRVYPDTSHGLYIHEKEILDDAGHADQSLLVGSQNASITSLTRNRELSVRITDAHGGATAIGQAAATFDADFRGASAWSSRVPATHRPTPPPTTAATASPTVPVVPTASTVSTAASTGCHPLSNAGHCYEPGEFCRATDHGVTGVDGKGRPITCADNDGWRWEGS